MEKRIEKYKEVRRILKEEINNNEACIFKNKNAIIIFNIKTKKPIISFSKILGYGQDGEVWLGCSPTDLQKGCKRNSLNFAIKVLPITKKEYYSKGNTKYECWREIKILETTTRLVKDGITPNLPMMYYYSKCSKINVKNYANRNIIKRIKDNWGDFYGRYAIYIYNEPADYDFYKWMRKEDISNVNIIYSLLFQIFAGLSVLHNKLNMVHMDLHGGNIFIVKNKSNDKYLIYELDNTKYYIPTYGYQFIIWDFSVSLLLDENSKTEVFESVMDKVEWFLGRKITNNEDNIEKNLYGKDYKKYQKYIFSFDVLRLIRSVSYTVKDNPKINQNIHKLLYNIEKDATYDLTVGLTGKTDRFEYYANIKDIIKKYFGKYTKKPRNIKENKVYKIY